MAPKPEAGSHKGKETAEHTMEEQVRQWEAYAASLQQQLNDKNNLLVEKDVEVQTLQIIVTGKKRAPKTPNPDPFHGDANKIEAFIMQLVLKMMDHLDYESEDEKK